jgi:uncharacterized protein YjbI with pentapeptide repeats
MIAAAGDRLSQPMIEIRHKTTRDLLRSVPADTLAGGDFEEAPLHGADLREADLSGANLSGARLQGADLSHTDLRGTNLRGANLCGTNLAAARYNLATRWPGRFNPRTHGACLVE